MVEGATSAKLLSAEPDISPPAPLPLSVMLVTWLLVAVGLDAAPAVPVLPLMPLMAPAVVMPVGGARGLRGLAHGVAAGRQRPENR